MNILNITLLTTNGTDELIITTDLPNGQWPYTGNQEVKMVLAAGSGEEYIKKHFPSVEYKIIGVK